ncbi:transposase [Falsiruegeria litorea]|uniref:transposase n=1 Tax=Falsiruegeria litorea TaxID=1280831 RepID=UPI000A2723B6
MQRSTCSVTGERPTRVRTQKGCKPTHHRLVLAGNVRIWRTGIPWCGLPKESGKCSSVHRQFWCWALAGL